MIIQRLFCAICDNKLNKIFSIDNIPISLCCSYEINTNRSIMSFAQCEKCNTIQLDKLIELKLLYSESHNYTSVGEIWDKYFLLFNSKIKNMIKDKTILEIGCPSGKICLKNDNYNKWYIIEPNKNKDIVFNENIIFIESFFHENLVIEESIDIIIHSHLFEHIYDPNNFLKKCYELLSEGGEMFFGVPTMQHFAETGSGLFLGIFFEHTIFLNKENITYLLNKNGFSICEIIDYENHSTIYHVKKNNIINKIDIEPFYIENFYENFISGFNKNIEFINKCNSIIENTTKDVYIFGASYSTQILLSLGINTQRIKGILDNNKEKQNKYLFGRELLIYGPEVINNKECVVILKMGSYSNEIYKQLKTINNTLEILS